MLPRGGSQRAACWVFSAPSPPPPLPLPSPSPVLAQGCVVANNTLRVEGLPLTDNAAGLGAVAVVIGNVWAAPAVANVTIWARDCAFVGNQVMAPSGTSPFGGQVCICWCV